MEGASEDIQQDADISEQNQAQQLAKHQRHVRELAYLNQQNILEDATKIQTQIGQQDMKPHVKIATPAEMKQSLYEIMAQRKLAKTQQLNNLDSQTIPQNVASILPNKVKLFESMRRHEIELKSYLRGKITNLKEDIIQGHQKSATKRLLAIQALVQSNQSEWEVKLFGKVQGEQTEMMCFFDKLKITFEGTDSYQPIEWIKNRIANANDFNGIQIKRQFTPADKKFVLKVTLDLETSPKRFTLSPQLAGILGIQEETRAKIVSAFWQYIKSNRLQDADDRRIVNLNSKLQTIFGSQSERFEFHQLLSLLKPHLHEIKPLEILLEIERERNYTNKYVLPITFQAQNLKPMLQFLVDHDYDFQRAAVETNVPEAGTTLASQLHRREIKANLKIASLIDKMKRSQLQMSFYEQLSKGDLSHNLKNTIVKQNDLLKLLQEEPDTISYGTGAYHSNLGMGSHSPVNRSVEATDTKFFEDNKKWIMQEVGNLIKEEADVDQPDL